jgi:hypothetical protein
VLPASQRSGEPAEEQARRLGERMAEPLRRTGFASGSLSNGVRAVAEDELGVSLGGVTLRDDAAARAKAVSHRALAVTEGSDISFSSGVLRSDHAGAALLGHELAHAAQQRQAGVTAPQLAPMPGAMDRLSERFGGIPTPAAAPQGAPTSLAEFERVMLMEFGVGEAAVGTYEEQERRQGPGIPREHWVEWDPSASPEVFRAIRSAFERLEGEFGGAVTARRIVFFDTLYEPHPTDPTLPRVPNRTVGATFGAGELTVYRAASTGPFKLPKPGGGLDSPTAEQNVLRVTAHELGHGLAESFGTAATGMIDDYARAVGWHNGMLFDIGHPEVAAAFAEGREPPKEVKVDIQPFPTLIQEGNWNSTLFKERPLSEYTLSSPAEDFAEAVMVFVVDPALLQQRSPRRFEFIQAIKDRLVPPKGDFPVPSGGTRYA